MIKNLHKFIKLLLCAMMLVTGLVMNPFGVKANEGVYGKNYNTSSKNSSSVIYHGTMVRYNNVYYDLSTMEGNYQFLYNNQHLTVDEYLDILFIVIDSIDATNVSARQLVDPDLGGGTGYTYFVSMSWFYRSTDGWNLKLIPRDLTRLTLQNASIGWRGVKSYQSSNSHWTNERSLEGQYFCHWTFANQKEDWNIAPSIPYRNAFEWISERCN